MTLKIDTAANWQRCRLQLELLKVNTREGHRTASKASGQCNNNPVTTRAFEWSQLECDTKLEKGLRTV